MLLVLCVVIFLFSWLLLFASMPFAFRCFLLLILARFLFASCFIWFTASHFESCLFALVYASCLVLLVVQFALCFVLCTL